MRIIAGEKRGLVLKTVSYEGFRPTLDRVKESLFGILTPHIRDARVLDLFAGSGALSLEAISRGAASALLIDSDKRAAKVIEQNLVKAGLTDRCRFALADFEAAGKTVARGSQFDLVFADPPYDGGFAQRVLNHLRTVDLLAPEGLLSLEMSRKEMADLDSTGFEVLRPKRFGFTFIWIMRKK
jgi:16S rRNA (guanine966-N2)-methyltransferase